MQNLLPQNKLAFWAVVIALLGLTMIPSLAVIQTAQKYVRFLFQWSPGTIPMTHTRHTPRRDNLSDNAQQPQIRFVEFTLDAPKASRVLIAGNFNDWQPETMTLQSGKKQLWHILLPLPPGRYQYAFQIDGAWKVDPKATESGQKGEIKTSIREVP